MMFRNLVLFFLFFSSFSIVQAQFLEGFVKDEASLDPIPFADLFIMDLEIATTADSNGHFLFTNSLPTNCKIRITALGYENLLVSLSPQELALEIFLREKHFELDEVTVSSSKNSMQKYNVTPVETRKISDLNAIASTTLGEALSSIPGVYRSTTGVGISKPVVRGMQGTRVVMLLNGMRIENQQWGGDHGMGITELGIGSVEVVKGPSSLLYGADALGGIVHFIDEPYTKQNTYDLGFKSQNESNSRGSSNQFWYKTARKNYRLNLAASVANHADYKLPNGLYAQNSRFSEEGLKAAFGTNKHNWTMHVRYNFSKNRVGIIGASEDSIVIANGYQVVSQERIQAFPQQQFKNHFLSVENKWFLRKNEVHLLLGQTLNQLTEFEEGLSSIGINMNLFNSLYHFKVKTKGNDHLNFVSGLQGMVQKNQNLANAEEQLLPNSITVDNGIYSIAFYEEKRWNFQGGLRYDIRYLSSMISNETPTPFSNLYQSGNFSTGIVRNGASSTVRFNISSGFRAPHLSELLADGFHHGALRYEIGDRHLKSEKATQFDFSYSFHHEHFELIINPFWNKVKDYITALPTDSVVENLPVYRFQQIAAVYLFGTDVGFHYHPHFAHWLHLESSVSFLQAEVNVGQGIALMPQNRVNTFLRVKFNSKTKLKLAELTVQHSFFARQDRTAVYETNSPAYQLFNAAVSFKYGSNKPLAIHLGVKNILNTSYIDHLSRLKNVGLNSPGRNVYVSMVHVFASPYKK
jgi:iron complex outermembrane recepter protein